MAKLANTYSTQSLYEAAYLLSRDFKLVSKDSAGQKTCLHFLDTPVIRQAVMDFYNGSGMVSAKAFVDAYRSLKDFCFTR